MSDKYDLFKENIQLAAEKFKKLDRNKPIRLISHLDADGISAASIMIRALDNLDWNYSVAIIRQLSEDNVQQFADEDYEQFVFTDLGSSQLPFLIKHMPDKKVFILDHHEPFRGEIPDNYVCLNPHYVDIDGSREIAGAGVVYMFAETLDKKNMDMAHIAIIGAIGDVQEKNGFQKLNNNILQTAIRKDRIMVKKGLRIFGLHTKYVHKILEQSYDMRIPDVTGNESNAIQFLKELDINPKKGSLWKRYNDLTSAEIERLIEAILIRRRDGGLSDDIFNDHYILISEKENSPFREVREFSTILNACGRMDRASYGIGACLGDDKMKKRAAGTLAEYKREIGVAWRWFENNKGTEFVRQGDGYIIINAGDNIRGTMAGTFASILSKSRDVKENTFIMSLAQMDTRQTKVSLRIAGRNPRKDIDLRNVIMKITDSVNGEAGGHKYAAGAIIDSSKENEFVNLSERLLSSLAMEEEVN